MRGCAVNKILIILLCGATFNAFAGRDLQFRPVPTISNPETYTTSRRALGPPAKHRGNQGLPNKDSTPGRAGGPFHRIVMPRYKERRRHQTRVRSAHTYKLNRNGRHTLIKRSRGHGNTYYPRHNRSRSHSRKHYSFTTRSRRHRKTHYPVHNRSRLHQRRRGHYSRGHYNRR